MQDANAKPETSRRIYTVAEFDKSSDAGIPRCRSCNQFLGVRRSAFSPTGRDEWWCDICGRTTVTVEAP